MKKAILLIMVLLVSGLCFGCADDFGLSDEAQKDPAHLSAEETVRYFFYSWNKHDYEAMLKVIDEKSKLYRDIRAEYNLAENSDKENVEIPEDGWIEVASVTEEPGRDGDEETYCVKWKKRLQTGDEEEETYFVLRPAGDGWVIKEATLFA